MGNNSPAPGRAHGHKLLYTAIRVSVTISQPLVTLPKRAHRSRPPRLLQEEHGCLERGAWSLWEQYLVKANTHLRALGLLVCGVAAE